MIQVRARHSLYWRMYCFKYYSPRTTPFGMLSRGELFFASPAELNDGSECRSHFVLQGAPELWDRLCDLILFEIWIAQAGPFSEPSDELRSLLTLALPLSSAIRRRKGRRDLDAHRLGDLIADELPTLLETIDIGVSADAVLRLARKVVHEKIGKFLEEYRYIASFSLDPCDPTMWGHYGEAERGFAVVVKAPGRVLSVTSTIPVFHGVRPKGEGLGLYEIGIYKEAEIELQSVNYKISPPRINALQRLVPHFRFSSKEHHYDVPELMYGDAQSKQEDQFGLVKASTWKYEREVRGLFPSVEKLSPEVRCVRLHQRHVAGLIFGPKMSVSDRERAVVSCYMLRASNSNVDSDPPPFVFINASPQADRFKMKLSLTGVLGGFYAGKWTPFEAIGRVDNEIAATAGRIFDKIRSDP